MQYTKNLNLKKPDQNDYVNIADINENMDVLDESVQKKYEKPTTGISKTDLSQPVQDSLQKADNAATQTELTKTNEAVATHMADLAHVHWIGTAIGTNTLTATYEAITALKNGLGVAFLNTTSSTGATTLNINGLGATPILKANGNPVTNLKANGIYTIRYANGNFILQGEGGEYGTATASDVVAGKTFGTENGLMEGLATIASLGGKKWAKGTLQIPTIYNGTENFVVSGLSFTPNLIFMFTLTGRYSYGIYSVDENKNAVAHFNPGEDGFSSWSNFINVAPGTFTIKASNFYGSLFLWYAFE